MPGILVIIDTRFRVAGSLSDFIIDIPASIEVKKLSLVYADIPQPGGWAQPAFLVEIEGATTGVLYTGGGSGSAALQGFCSFVIPSANAIFREESDFEQMIYLTPPQRYARIRVRILGADGALAGMTKDSFLILRAE